MRVTASVNVAPVGTYYSQLAVMLRQDMPKTLRMEAAATVRRAMQMVSHSRVSSVRRAAMRNGIKEVSDGTGYKIIVGVGKKNPGKMSLRDAEDYGNWFWIGRWNGTLSPLRDHDGIGWKIPDRKWAQAKSTWAKNIPAVKAAMAKKIGARGITARSYFEILMALGSGGGAAPSFVQRARPISGKMRTVGMAHTFGENSANPSVVVTNTSGVAIATGGQRTLESAIAIRRAFFMRAMSDGFFFDAKFVAKNYPWAKVT